MAIGTGAVRWANNQIASNAGEDLSGKEFYAGRLNADGSFGVAVTPATVLGVLRDSPKAIGDTSTMQIADVSQAIIGAAVAVGALLAPAGDGRFITATTGQRSVVRALQAGTVANQLVTALIGRVETA